MMAENDKKTNKLYTVPLVTLIDVNVVPLESCSVLLDVPRDSKSLHLPLRPIEYRQRVCFRIEHPLI